MDPGPVAGTLSSIGVNSDASIDVFTKRASVVSYPKCVVESTPKSTNHHPNKG